MKWGSTLNTCVHAYGINANLLMEASHKKTFVFCVFPHCTIKITCQKLASNALKVRGVDLLSRNRLCAPVTKKL